MYIESTCAFCDAHVTRKKQSALANVKIHFCNIDCKARWQRLQHPVTNEWLRQKYVNEGLDCTAIARLVNRDPKSVWTWIKNAGIETRRRGLASGHKFKTGDKSPFLGRRHTDATRRKLSAIAKLDGRVPYDPAVGSYMKGRKGVDSPSWKGGLTPARQAFYSTLEWRNCVKAVWHRDDAICRRCGLDHRTILRGVIRFDIHHIDSFMIVERRADLDNLALLCQHCHKWIHSKKNKRKVLLGKGH